MQINNTKLSFRQLLRSIGTSYKADKAHEVELDRRPTAGHRPMADRRPMGSIIKTFHRAFREQVNHQTNIKKVMHQLRKGLITTKLMKVESFNTIKALVSLMK
jgi:hypothetical protein